MEGREAQVCHQGNLSWLDPQYCPGAAASHLSTYYPRHPQALVEVGHMNPYHQGSVYSSLSEVCLERTIDMRTTNFNHKKIIVICQSDSQINVSINFCRFRYLSDLIFKML